MRKGLRKPNHRPENMKEILTAEAEDSQDAHYYLGLYNNARKHANITSVMDDEETMEKIFNALIDLEYSNEYIKKFFTYYKNLHNPYRRNIEYMSRFIKLKINRGCTYTLDLEDIKQFNALEVKTKNEQYVKDIFLFSMATAMLPVDIFRINERHIQKGNIVFFRSKSKVKSVVPINEVSDKIFRSYMLPFKWRSRQHLSTKLTEIMQRSEHFCKDVEIQKEKGNQTVIEIVPKYKAITFRSARKTACNLWFEEGLTLKEIQRRMGHRSIQMTDQWYNDWKANLVEENDKFETERYRWK